MNRAAAIALSPLSGLYGAMMNARSALYRSGVFRVHEVDAPVISVGNITTGGTGKTPLAALFAREFARYGKRVCILTRGHGRQNSRQRVVVSNRSEIVSDAHIGGDEPVMLAEKLKGIAAVISDADRISAARWAIENLGSDLFILDDGFQHLKIARDFDVVVVDASNPWGNGRLLPAGTLREPRRSLSRADCVVLTRVDDQAKTESLKLELERLTAGRPVFSSRMTISGLRSVDSTTGRVEAAEVKSSPVTALCAVGNSESFFNQLRRGGFQLSQVSRFRDHHVYDQTDINRLTEQSKANGSQALITTAKDEVKLRGLNFALPCYVADIEIEIDQEAALVALIDEAIRR